MPKGSRPGGVTALNQTHEVPLEGRREAELTVAGAHVATHVVETSVDQGTTWQGHPIRNGSAFAASVTAVGTYQLHDLPDAPGARVRVRCSAFTSGNPSVTLETK